MSATRKGTGLTAQLKEQLIRQVMQRRLRRVESSPAAPAAEEAQPGWERHPGYRELDILRQVKNVIRGGRVRRIDPGVLRLERGDVAADRAALYIDCTARGITWSRVQPVFDDKRVTLQFVRDGRITDSKSVCSLLWVDKWAR